MCYHGARGRKRSRWLLVGLRGCTHISFGVPRALGAVQLRSLDHHSPGYRVSFLFRFDSVTYNPLHGARRAMAASVLLPLAGQRRAFLGVPISYPRTMVNVIVGVPQHLLLPKAARKQTKENTKHASHPLTERKRKVRVRVPWPPLLLHLHGPLDRPSLLHHLDIRLAPVSPWAAAASISGSSGASMTLLSLRGGGGHLQPLASPRASLLAAQASALAP